MVEGNRATSTILHAPPQPLVLLPVHPDPVPARARLAVRHDHLHAIALRLARRHLHDRHVVVLDVRVYLVVIGVVQNQVEILAVVVAHADERVRRPRVQRQRERVVLVVVQTADLRLVGLVVAFVAEGLGGVLELILDLSAPAVFGLCRGRSGDERQGDGDGDGDSMHEDPLKEMFGMGPAAHRRKACHLWRRTKVVKRGRLRGVLGAYLTRPTTAGCKNAAVYASGGALEFWPPAHPVPTPIPNRTPIGTVLMGRAAIAIPTPR